MAENKRYYWLKLKEDFFGSKRIKKLRRLAGGDTYTIIYLKMQLLAMKSDGVLTFTGLEASFAEELALDLDEDTDDVRLTLAYLTGCGLVETSDDINFFIPYAVENVGSETDSTQRSRACRERLKVQQTAASDDGMLLQCNTSATQVQHTCNTEKEKEKDIRAIYKSESKNIIIITPTLEDIEEYIKSHNLNVNAKKFFSHYEAQSWKINGRPFKWEAKLEEWSENEKPKSGYGGKTESSSPASYDIAAVTEKMNTTVPKYRKRV